jgi:hypothetical protein
MLIPNLPTFTGLDPATTPQIQHGSLDPSMQFASAELLAMAMGSIYIQKSVIVGQNCAILGTSACLWLKVGRTQDACNPLGSPKDWRRCCCFTLLEGATPPSPGVDPWCKAQTGDWYLQTPTNGGCKGLWLKIRDDCGANDWINVLGNKCLVTGLTPPDPVALCDYDIGSNYVDLARSCPVVYLKIRDNCDANDWINLSEAASSSCGIWMNGHGSRCLGLGSSSGARNPIIFHLVALTLHRESNHRRHKRDVLHPTYCNDVLGGFSCWLDGVYVVGAFRTGTASGHVPFGDPLILDASFHGTGTEVMFIGHFWGYDL